MFFLCKPTEHLWQTSVFWIMHTFNRLNPLVLTALLDYALISCGVSHPHSRWWYLHISPIQLNDSIALWHGQDFSYSCSLLFLKGQMMSIKRSFCFRPASMSERDQCKGSRIRLLLLPHLQFLSFLSVRQWWEPCGSSDREFGALAMELSGEPGSWHNSRT